MKNLTLTAIIIFISTYGFMYADNFFSVKNEMPVNQSKLDVKQTKNIKNVSIGIDNQDINETTNEIETTNKTEITYSISTKVDKVLTVKDSHINPPNLNINKLVFMLENANKGSFTLVETSKHNSVNDCYIIINNNVYNVSSYISHHPGGSRTITSNCGKEVTGIFAKIHSNRAWDLLKKYKIGTVTSNKFDVTEKVLSAISNALESANPSAKVIKVTPKKNFYIAKIIFNKKLYEVHIGNSGQILKEEIENDEPDWSLWESDADDK